jgi:riboflavin synthase
MFTGIIEELGRVTAVNAHDTGVRLTIQCSSILADVSIGASIAVNGACLTAVDLSLGSFSAELAPETLRRTNLKQLQEGSAVNLERPLRANGRLDGHFVLGHVDGTAEILALKELGDDNWWLEIRLPPELVRYVVSKGSVALDGISLTVAELNGYVANFTIIPHTYRHTTLNVYRPGDYLNVEVDILAKHLEKLVRSNQPL